MVVLAMHHKIVPHGRAEQRLLEREYAHDHTIGQPCRQQQPFLLNYENELFAVNKLSTKKLLVIYQTLFDATEFSRLVVAKATVIQRSVRQ